MGYTQVGDVQDWMQQEPLDACADRIRRAALGFLLERVRHYTPVAKLGVSIEELGGGGRARAPGTLKASWRIVGLEEVRSDDPIVEFVEYDTRPHDIRPRIDRQPASIVESRKPRAIRSDSTRRPTDEEIDHDVVGRAALRFVEGGRVIYATVVHHPGTRGAHMLAKALADLQVAWPHLAEIEIERWAAQVNATP